MRYSTILLLFSLCCILSCKQEQKAKEQKPALEIRKEIKKDFWENGELASEGIYINGKANGQMKWFHDNGFLAGEGPMKNDKRNGLWKVYNRENGKLSAEGSFKDDLKHGKWKIFHENGTLWKEQFWDFNKLITEQEFSQTKTQNQ
ncbi:hypothetical protein [Tenacibaculum sp. 190524A05c]|uniref:toxin-antitoxin system YwqK family antitoxin n=1 Tax=Tenacibaculum platacis TaxID=3137852 RepID=UPI0031FB1053